MLGHAGFVSSTYDSCESFPFALPSWSAVMVLGRCSSRALRSHSNTPHYVTPDLGAVFLLGFLLRRLVSRTFVSFGAVSASKCAVKHWQEFVLISMLWTLQSFFGHCQLANQDLSAGFWLVRTTALLHRGVFGTLSRFRWSGGCLDRLSAALRCSFFFYQFLLIVFLSLSCSSFPFSFPCPWLLTPPAVAVPASRLLDLKLHG